MTVRSAQWAASGWLVIAAGVAALLNSPLMFPAPRLWMRVLPPILLLFGAVAELSRKAGYRLVLVTVGAWLFLLVVFLWSFVGDREAHNHPAHETLNALVQLFFSVLVLIWVYWRKKLIHRNLAELQAQAKASR